MAKKQFDLNTHVRNGKGVIVSKNPYRLVIENGVHRYERPPGSGFWYDSAGTCIQEPKQEVLMQDPKGKNVGNSNTKV